MVGRHRHGERGLRDKMHVEIKRLSRDRRNRAFNARIAARDDFDPVAVAGLENRDRGGRDVLVARRAHFVARGQIDPQLEAAHQPFFLFGHFGMHDAASGGHPLHRARLEQADIALVVAVAHAAREHVGHGFEAAMRMVGKAREIGLRIVRAEFVEHQKRVEIGQPVRSDYAREFDAGPVAGGLAAHDFFDVSFGGCHRTFRCLVARGKMWGFCAANGRGLLRTQHSLGGNGRCAGPHFALSNRLCPKQSISSATANPNSTPPSIRSRASIR